MRRQDLFDFAAITLLQATASEVAEQPVETAEINDKRIVRAQHTYLRISPRKLNEILRPIRGLNVEEALIQLKLSPHNKAVFVYNCIRSAKISA